MSYEVITAGELAFPSAAKRAAWQSANRQLLAGFADAKSHHSSMVYYLDLTGEARTLVVRGLVHRDGFHELVEALTNASAFGATGRIDFETTESDCHELVCKNGGAVYREAASAKLGRDVVGRIFEESERRANPGRTSPPDAEEKKLLARARALRVPSDSKDLIASFDREFRGLLREVENVRNPSVRRELLQILGKRGAEVRAARKAARSATAKAVAAKRKAEPKRKTSGAKSPRH